MGDERLSEDSRRHGRAQVRTGEEFGDIFDHHSVVYEYENGTRIFSNTRQQAGCYNNISTTFVGSKGHADVSERRSTITGNESWRYDGKHKNMYQVEHDELFASIRAGQPINNGDYMAYSTLLAIMGRMATYTGKDVTWDEALNSSEALVPEAYSWDANPPKVEVALPGLTSIG